MSIGSNLPKVAWSMLVLSVFVVTGLYISFSRQIEKSLRARSYSYLLSSAKEAENKGDTPGAELLYTQLIERYSGREEGLIAYAEFLNRHGRDTEADPFYQRAIDAGRQGYDALIRYTNFLDTQPSGQFRAINACRAYLARYPDDAWTKFELGRRLLWQGKPAEAIPYLESASLNESLDDFALRKLGEAHSQLGDFAQAIRVWQRALDSHTTTESRQVLFDMAVAQKKLGSTEQAASLWQQHLAYFPNSKWTLLELDTLYSETKNDVAREPIRQLLIAMRPAVPVNHPLQQFISLTGVTPHFAEVTPGQATKLECHIAYLDSVLSGQLPEMRFGLTADGTTSEPTSIRISSSPPRLGPLPVWRGDSVRQTFAIVIPVNISAGHYTLVLLKDQPDLRPVALCPIAVAGEPNSKKLRTNSSQPAPSSAINLPDSQ